MDPTYTIAQWALFALTGDMASASPTSGQLAPVIASVTAELSAAYPCIGADPLTALTTQADLDAFAEWAGYEVAARYMATPAGALLSGARGGTVREKSGRVERTRTEPGTAAHAASYRRPANAARLRISCIREAVAQANGNAPGLLDIVGRRRAIGDAPSVEGQILGIGREGQV